MIFGHKAANVDQFSKFFQVLIFKKKYLVSITHDLSGHLIYWHVSALHCELLICANFSNIFAHRTSDFILPGM